MYQGIEVYNGTNKIMHWFSNRDTVHYLYANGVQECDKNGGLRTNWVKNAGSWTKQKTPVHFTPYPPQIGATSTTWRTSSIRPKINTGTQSDDGLTIKTGTLENGTQYKIYYRQDGTKARGNFHRTDGSSWTTYYRTDETKERRVSYRTDGTKNVATHYRTDGSKETVELYKGGGRTREYYIYYDKNGTRKGLWSSSEMDEDEQPKDGVDIYYREDGTKRVVVLHIGKREEYKKIREIYYRTDGTEDRIVHYKTDGRTQDRVIYTK